jgi:hypothetical protein
MGLNKPNLEFDRYKFQYWKDSIDWNDVYTDQREEMGARWQHSETAKLVETMWEIIELQNDALNLATELLVVPEHMQDSKWYEKSNQVDETLAAVEEKIKKMGKKV